MKLPILGSKWIIIIAVVITTVIVAPMTAKITSKIKDKEFARTEKVYQKTIDMVFGGYSALAKEAKYTISNTYTIKKNKKGQTIFVPTSTMEIDKIIKSIDEKIMNPDGTVVMEQDSSQVTPPKDILSWFKDLFKSN